jgi:hypothetical protein
VVVEISQIWHGMAIVIPTEKWTINRRCTAEEFAAWICDVGRHVPMAPFRRHRRVPKNTAKAGALPAYYRVLGHSGHREKTRGVLLQ